MHFYRALLHLFPRSFRAEYGARDDKGLRARVGGRSGAAVYRRCSHTRSSMSSANAMRVHLDILRQDVRYAIRSLRRTPGFTITAILVAALGIGATTATFSIADHVLLRPLPFPEPDRLVRLCGEPHRAAAIRAWSRRRRTITDWQRHGDVVREHRGLQWLRRRDADRQRRARTDRRRARHAGGVFQMLGRQAAIGRTLTEADAAARRRTPMVISDRLWRTRFAARVRMSCGQTLTLDDAHATSSSA